MKKETFTAKRHNMQPSEPLCLNFRIIVSLSPMHSAITTTAFVPCNAMHFKKGHVRRSHKKKTCLHRWLGRKRCFRCQRSLRRGEEFTGSECFLVGAKEIITRKITNTCPGPCLFLYCMFIVDLDLSIGSYEDI